MDGQNSEAVGFLFDLLRQLAPKLVPLVPLTAPALKLGMDVLKWLLRTYWNVQFQGNVVQTATFLLALGCTALLAQQQGVFADGTTAQELLGLGLVAAINAAGATWVDQLAKNTNKPPAPLESSGDASAALEALKQHSGPPSGL